ncbi:MAG: carboxypeptidase regulatory-like domain-containing protein, partial [Acidobacteria bacterium]|nr:carboxypeptidase regulatory-like domain-containing protein [Acidobacteriota bacterium]
MAKALLGCALGVALLATLSTPALAQTVTGTIQGTVTDTSGGVLPGATVTIRHQDTGAQRVVVTNEVGLYSAPFMQIGRYTVTATLTGFGAMTREQITVGLNETRVADFKLDPRVTDTVTVKGEPPPINLTKAEVRSSLTEQQIMDKPSLNANGFLSLAETFPGFQENPTSGQNNPTASSGSSINFNNTGSRGATFQINGVNNDDSSENQHRQGVALSTIQEFQILKNSYSAEFGRADGAVVLVQTKSGTNRVRGDVYTYRRENDWNARSWFTGLVNPKPPRAEGGRNQYGFTAGFPVMRNKVFAFGSADYAAEDGQGGYTREFILPSDINVPWLTRGNDTPENRAWIQSIVSRFPSSLTNNDARSPRVFTGLRELDFPDWDYTGRLDWNLPRMQTLST